MDELWEFYEWEKTDYFSYVKKIPLFRVSFETLKDFMTYHIQMDLEFLSSIAHKTSVRGKEDIPYAFLMNDTKNSLAVLLNEEGTVVALSKTLVADDNNIGEFMYTLKETDLPYKKQEKRKKKCGLRQENDLKRFIMVELSTLLEEKNVQKLKYLYYEWFNEEEDEFEKMYQKMYSSLQHTDISVLERISYVIKLSYHQV